MADQMTTPQTLSQVPTQQLPGQLPQQLQSRVPYTTDTSQPHFKGGKTWPKYQGTKSRRLGIVQIALSVLIVVTSCVGAPLHESFTDNPNLYTVGFGFWCPIFSIVSGSFAIQADKVKTTAKLKKIVGWSLASFFLVMGGVTSWSCVAIPTILWEENDWPARMGMVGILSIQLAAGLAVGITSIWLSKLAGDFVCCCQKEKTTVHYITTTHPDGSVTQQVWTTVASNSLQTGLPSAHLAPSNSMPPTGQLLVVPLDVSANGGAHAVSPPPYTEVNLNGTKDNKLDSPDSRTYL